MRIGVQLYTLRNELANHFEETLEKISKLGYDGVEFAGFYGIPALDMKPLLERLNLKALGSHTSLEDLENKFEEIVEYNQIIENSNIVIPWSDLKTEKDFEIIMPKIKSFTERLTALGFTVHYHNHSHEFVLNDGVYLLDKLFTAIPGLHPELDLYWVNRAGLEPLSYYKQYEKKALLLHFKDSRDDYYAPVGTGLINYKEILKEALKAKAEWIIVENDDPKQDAIEDISISIRNLKTFMNEVMV